MYSLILMTALSAAPEQQDFNGFFRRLFSFGHNSDCYGTSRKSSGCYGSDKYGCYGSRLRAFDPESCSCYGSAATSRVSASCYGSASYSCYGDGIPSRDLATPSPTMSAMPPASSLSSGYLLTNPMPIGEPFLISGPPVMLDNNPARELADSTTARRATNGMDNLASNPNRAKVVIRLPQDAKLFAEGRSLQLTGNVREFVTPVLPTNQEFFYTFRAEYVREGETISQSKRLAVKAGGTFNLDFADLTQAKLTPKIIPDASGRPNPLPLAAMPETPSLGIPPLLTSGNGPKTPSLPVGEPLTRNTVKPALPTGLSAERARITVKLPPGTTLYVDGKRNDRKELIREFTTPPLPPGQEFAYFMKAETIRNGQPDTQSTKVTFRAGEIVTVDFTAVPEKR